MKLLEIKPMLYTLEVKATADFYVNVLGFSHVNNSEDRSWASFRRDNIEIMATRPNEHLPFEKPLFTGSFYISTDNADAVWDEVKEKVSICYPIETFDYGMREFAIFDNNGYILQFGQEV